MVRPRSHSDIAAGPEQGAEVDAGRPLAGYRRQIELENAAALDRDRLALEAADEEPEQRDRRHEQHDQDHRTIRQLDTFLDFGSAMAFSVAIGAHSPYTVRPRTPLAPTAPGRAVNPLCNLPVK